MVYCFACEEANGSAIFKNKILGSKRKYAIYLPSDYEYSKRGSSSMIIVMPGWENSNCLGSSNDLEKLEK